VSELAAWLERQQSLHPKSIDLTLDRVTTIARRLGVDRPPCPVFIVGGTNGKGSTVAFLDRLLRASGRKVGAFTSPHLVHYNERICIDGTPASDAELIAAFEHIEAVRHDVSLTFFEYNTLAALEVFARAKVAAIVLEVGLGGRLDATNLVDADVAVLTSVALDHMEWLGPTREVIGREKAGIFRHGRPAVLATPDLPDSVFQSIGAIGARPFVAGREYWVSEAATQFDFRGGSLEWCGLALPTLAGAHQLQNASAALAAIVSGDFLGDLTRERASEAIAATTVRGRFQRAQRAGVEWVLDVAHNPAAATVLADNLRSHPVSGRTLAILGVLADKDARGIVAAVDAEVDAWCLVDLDGPRGRRAVELAESLPPNAVTLDPAASVENACATLARTARHGDRVVVFGSFHTVGPALEFLGL
jgi:dihydrofolate synthase/folylpolyglutamate synthase